MKRVLSLVLSLVMAISIITGMDVSVFAVDTEVESYNIYKADRYAEAFDDIFVGTGSSSYARNFYNELVNDKLLMGEIVAWESLHMIASPSYSIESGMFTKYDYFKTVLFDLIISKSEDTIATKAQDNFEYLFDQVKNSKNSFIVSTAKKVTSTEEGLTIVKLKETKLTDFHKTTILNSTRFADSVAVASDVMQILEWCDNVYDAIELTSNYCALTDVYDGTKEVLQYIANDTRNNDDVRLAATNCIECMGDSYTEIVNAMCIGSFSLFIDVGLSFVSETWKYILATIPGGQVVTAAMLGLQGARVIVNLLMSEDDKTKAYYQIESNVICEDAIIRAVSGLKDIYLNNKTEENAIIYLRAIEMYKDDILLGFDYSIDLLEVLVEANLSTIIGTYNEGIKLINELYSYKSQKLNNFTTFEDAINTAYINTYMPDYNTVLNEYNNQEIVEVESISLELIDEINVGDTGYIGNYIDVIKYPANANDLFVEDFVSLNEDVIKLNEYDFIEVVGTGECTIVCKQGTEFETTITVTVGETSADDTVDYLGDFSYTINSDGTTATIIGYTGSQSRLIIPGVIDGYDVTSIGDKAFFDCDSFTSVTIPGSVTSIGDSAFYNCGKLTSVTIPNSVTSIGDDAFYNCDSLTSVTIGDSVTSIGAGAFATCNKLTAIKVNSGNDYFTSVDGVLFNKAKTTLRQFPAGKTATMYTIPDSVTSIGESAFSGCSELINVTIPDSVTFMGTYAFTNCKKLESIKIPCDLDSPYGEFQETWFSNCEKFETLILTQGASKSAEWLSDMVSDTNIKKIIFDEGITKIGCYAFQNCANIEELEFCSTIEDIQYCAFKNCIGLTSIVLPNNLRFLGSWAFENCSNLNDVSISSENMESIGKEVFCGTPFYNNSENWSNEVLYIGNCLIKANTVLEGAYNVDDNIIVLSDEAFKNCNKIIEVNLPNSVKFIGENTFESCYNLNKIVLSKEIVNFGEYAFKNCNNLKSVYYNGNIEDWLRYDCFTHFKQNGGYQYVGNNNPCCFGADLYINGEKLTTLEIPDSISIVYDCAFYNCNSIQEVIVSNSVTHIGQSAFEYCDNLNSIQLSQNIESIADSAFYYTGLDGYLTIPQSCCFIGDNAFNYSYFDGMCILNSKCEIGADAFHYNTTVYGYENSSAEEFCNNSTDDFGCGFEPIDGFNCGIGEHRFIVSYSSGNAKAVCAICNEEVVNSDNILARFVYSIENGEVVITDFIDETAKTLTIPERISNYPVTKVNLYTYKGMYTNNLESVYIPKTVREITNVYCYDNIYVDEENEWYCSVDGVLYNKTKTELVFCPYNKTDDVTIIDGVEIIKNGAFDYLNSISPIYLLTIPNSVKVIENQAFSDAYVVYHIFYAGTEEEWNEIEIGSENSNFLNSRLHFNAIDSDKSITVIPPTCTYGGHTTYKCNVCNEENRSNYVDALGHSCVLTETIEPTCTRDGWDVYTCSRCEHVYHSNYTNALGHNYSDWIIDQEATCTENGSKTKTCDFCGNVDSQVINAFGHSGDWVVKHESTCTAEGVKHMDCALCGERIEEIIPVIEHNYVDGFCNLCGKEQLPESEHPYSANCDDIQTIYREDAANIDVCFSEDTYTEFGYDNIYIYDRDDTLVGTYSGSALAGETVNIPGDTVKIRLTSDSSVQEYGYRVLSITANYEVDCTHNSVSWIVDMGATCETNGSRHSVCDNCGETIETETIYATGHIASNWAIEKEPTCTEVGLKQKLCIICGKVVETEDISATGHNSSSWIIDQEATVYKAGSKHKECTKCGETLKTATIKQLTCSKPVLKKVYNANSYVKVTWGTVKGADIYRVYRKTGTGDYEYIGSTANTYFNDKEAGAGKTCRYRIKAKNEAGYSEYSVSIAIKHIDEPTLKSIENSAYGVLIKWDKVTGAEKYNVYRKVSGGEYKYIGATSDTYYTDKTAESGTKYYYAIRGKRDDSVSSQSASLSKYYLADPTLNTPTSTSKGIGLRWSEVAGAEGYKVYRKTVDGSYKLISTEKGVSNVTFRDTTAKKGTKYYYKVKAYKSKTYSAYSNTKAITDKY